MKKELVDELLVNLKNMVDILQSVADDEEVAPTPKSKTPNFSHNKFEDMSDLDIEREAGYDQINDNVQRTKRTRKAYKPLNLTCGDCGRQVKVNPMFKKEPFVCDRCVGRKFGR